MCAPLFCTGETDCIRRMSPFCLSSVVVASLTHILDREVSLRLIDYQPHLHLNVVPVFRLQRAPHDRHVIHSRYAISRNALCSMGCGQSEILIAQPPVGGRLDGSRSRSIVAGITVGEVSGCGIFLSFVVPDSLSGVDFLSPALPVVFSREFRPESSDITGL